MAKLPAWLAAPPEPDGPFALLSDDEREQVRDQWRTTWQQVPFGEDFHGRCAERIERCVPVWAGPIRHRRLHKTASQLVVVHDPAEPDEAWLSLSHALPPLAWVPAGSSPASLAAALARYCVAAPPHRLELAGHTRVVKHIEVDDAQVIHRAIEGLELWIDDASWGSAHVDDPWAGLEPDAGMLMLSMIMQRADAQHGARAPSVARRTLWSRSILTIEQHPFDLWVFDMRYAPAPDARAVELLLGDGDQRSPGPLAMLPLDLAASLLRGDSHTLEALERIELDDWQPFDVALLCALAPGEATTVARLRELLAAWVDDERLAGLLEVVHAFDHVSLLFEAATCVRDHELLDGLHRVLRPGGAP